MRSPEHYRDHGAICFCSRSPRCSPPLPLQPESCSAGSTSTTSRLRSTRAASKAGWTFSSAIAAETSCTPRFSPILFGALNTAGNTNYAAVGLSAKFGDRIYIRPGLGIAVHTGSASDYYRTDKIAFGSRVLFEPEIGVGARLNGHLSVEASWVHMSHATLFSRENPGIDNLGVRLNLKL